MFGWLFLSWGLCYVAVAGGPKLIQVFSAVLLPLSFILLVILVPIFLSSEGKIDGLASSLYMGSATFKDSLGEPIDTSKNAKDLLRDTYAQVFFSVGVCIGVYFAYGSYNPPR